MKKLLALVIALLVIGVAGVSVIAQQVGAQNPVRARIHKMGAFGTGIAISQSDPMDFELIRVGVAGMKVSLANETKTVKVGVLHFGEDKYRLKEIEIGNGTASANIYLNDSQVGSISLESYPKGNKEVWAGTLTLNDVTYNAYIIQVPRKLKAVEKARRVFDYCEDHPARCLGVMKGIGSIICDPEQEGTSCRDKIKTFCESNPEDRRCIALRLAYCRFNLDDADCRADLMEVCKQNADDESCEKLGTVYDKLAGKRPQAIRKIPQWYRRFRSAQGG